MKEYLGCCIDANLSGEPKAIESSRRINTTLPFLYRHNQFLNAELRKLMCKSLIEQNFNYACISYTFYLAKKWKRKYMLLKINVSVFVKLTTDKGKNIIARKISKYWKGFLSFCVNKFFVSSRNICNTRSLLTLVIPLTKSNLR